MIESESPVDEYTGEPPMLVVTRRPKEAVVIGDDIMVVVLGVKGNEVRIGIRAPREVSVHREEIYERVLREREEKRSA
jgi:carbon storage regulator